MLALILYIKLTLYTDFSTNHNSNINIDHDLNTYHNTNTSDKPDLNINLNANYIVLAIILQKKKP